MVSLEEEMRELKRTRNALLIKHEQQDMASLKKQLEELKQENSWLMREQEIASLKKELEELQQDKISLLIENRDVQNEVALLERNISNTKRETDALMRKNQRKQQQVDSLKKSINELIKELEALLIQRQLEQREICSLVAQVNTKEIINRSLAKEIWICKKGLQQLEQRTVEQESSVACLSQYLTENRNAFDLEKQSALDDCQKTMEDQFHDRIHELKQQLISTKAELDYWTFLHGIICDETTAQELELTKRHKAQVKEILEWVSQGAPDCQVGQLDVQIKMEEDLVDATNHSNIACETSSSQAAS